MKYQQEKFTVSMPEGQAYRDNWDAVFGSKESQPALVDKSDIRKQVEQFSRAFDHSVSDVPTVPDRHDIRLRIALITEEFFELLEACDIDHGMQYDVSRLAPIHMDRVDLVGVADALADLDYVIEELVLAFGVNGKPIADEVHRSNMTKLDADGRPVRRNDGKILKGPGYSPPDVAEELRKQGWNG